MTTLDASLLIAVTNTRDVHHASATRTLMALEDSTLLLHAITLAEVLVGPARAGLAAAARDALQAQGLQIVGYDEDSPVRVAQLRADTGLALADSCVLDTALRKGSALASFDRRLVSAAESMGVEVVTAPA